MRVQRPQRRRLRQVLIRQKPRDSVCTFVWVRSDAFAQARRQAAIFNAQVEGFQHTLARDSRLCDQPSPRLSSGLRWLAVCVRSVVRHDGTNRAL